MKKTDRMKIAVIAYEVRLENETGNTRLLYLCQLLSEVGYEVDLITSTFQHWNKKQRNSNNICLEKYHFNLKLIYEPGYKKNVSLQRLRSHRILVRNLNTLLEKAKDYDLIYCEIPPNDMALVAAQYAKRRRIPFVADVASVLTKDMRRVNHIPGIKNLLFYPVQRIEKQVYSLVDGIVGTSDECRDIPFLYRERNIPNKTVYCGNEIDVFDREARANMSEVFKGKNEFWVTYAGAIGNRQDIKTFVLAAEELEKRGQNNIRIKILGNGPLRDELRSMADVKEIFNVEFIKNIPYCKMVAYLKSSDVLINSVIKKTTQSIPTKLGDYLAAGKPIINTGNGEEFCSKIEREEFGVNVIAEDVIALADVIEDLYENPSKCIKMGENARRVAVEQFDRTKTYQVIEQMIRDLIKNN